MLKRLGKDNNQDTETAIDLDKIASIKFSWSDDNITAELKYPCSGPSTAGLVTETIVGEVAQKLYKRIPIESDLNAPLTVYVTESGKLEERPMDPMDLEQKLAFQPEFVRTKAWYYYKQQLETFSGPIERRPFFIAFVNSKGSCSMRTFHAGTGRFIAKTYRAGNYQQEFAAIIGDAHELSINSQPNLERDCKERLPKPVLAYLKKQVKEELGGSNDKKTQAAL